jgi:parallel beta-helix repeat protein
MRHINLLLIVTACFGFATKVTVATDFYVNPKGKDTWSGTLKNPNSKLTDGPFKTPERAKAAVRILKKTKTYKDKVTVNLSNGLYILNQPLNFSLIDSGLPNKEILWQGETGAQVTVSGGMPISCKKRDNTYWECPLSQLPANTKFIDSWRIKGNTPKFELFVNDQKLELARWPDHEWAHIKLPLDKRNQFSTMEKLPDLTGDIKAAQVHIYPGNDWFDQYIGVDSVNKSANSIKLSTETSYDLASGRLFYLQNLPSLLNAQGEWLYDSKLKKIVFIPPIGIVPMKFMLSSLPNIIIADNVNNLSFKNFSIQHSAGTAFAIKNSNNIVLDQLDIKNIGGKGVVIESGQNVQLKNSKVHHTGAQGVVVSGGDRNSLQAAGHVVQNNHFHHMGTTLLAYSPGMEVNGVGVKIAHNLMEQGPGIAIWIKGNEHLMEKNEIHHFCLQSSDCGAIYSGRDWSARGNIIRYNYIHDIIGYGLKSVDAAKNQVVYQSPHGARGIYLDDGASGFEIKGNIIENPGSIGIQLGGGRDNKIINNYINTDGYALWVDNRWPTYNWASNQKALDESPFKNSIWQQKYQELATPMHNKKWPEGNRIEHNVIVGSNQKDSTLRYFLPKVSTIIANNLVWSASGKFDLEYEILEFKSKGLANWAKWTAMGVENDSIFADPCISISNKRLITCPDSPVKKIGFQTLPVDIGINQ